MLFIFTYCNKRVYELLTSILKEFFAVPAKIIGKVSFILLCALLTGMRHRSKRYLCWQSLPGACRVVGFLNPPRQTGVASFLPPRYHL
jgi:hypothetical protein